LDRRVWSSNHSSAGISDDNLSQSDAIGGMTITGFINPSFDPHSSAGNQQTWG